MVTLEHLWKRAIGENRVNNNLIRTTVGDAAATKNS